MFSDSMMLGGGRQAAFSIAHSVLLDGVADYFTRTPSVPGNRKTWTFSCWVKRTKMDFEQTIFSSDPGNPDQLFRINFGGANQSGYSDQIVITQYNGGYPNLTAVSSSRYRDPTSWYHLVICYDSGNADVYERIKLYVDGKKVPLSYPIGPFPQYTESEINVANRPLYLGRVGYVAWGNYTYTSVVMSQTCLIDGAALDPSAFGETDPVTGSWRPKQPSPVAANLPIYTMISRSAGTIIGNMTSGVGLTGLFDGNLSELNPSLPHSAEDLGWGGKAWGAGNERTVAYAIAYGSSNYGFYNSGYSVTLSLQGSNDSGSSWTTLGTTTFDDDGTDKPRRIDATTLAPYERHRVLIDAYVGATKASEFQFYEQAGLTAYGTNGFHLNFVDPANLGQDVSGNANHWTPVSLGAADVVADSPTNNFATWNQLDKGTGITFNGNLTLATTNELDAYYVGASLAFPTSKNWYWEIHIDSSAAESLGNGSSILLGVKTTDDSKVWSYSETYAGSGLYNYRGDKFSTEGQWESYTGDPFTTGDTISVLWNGTDRSLRFWKNGVDQGVAYSGLPQDALIPMAYVNNYTGDKITANFGQRPFAFNPPASFESLCTANLPTPMITSPAKHFDVLTYTGTGVPQSITGLHFQPDFVWIKRRNSVSAHVLSDSVRGATKQLFSNLTNSEQTSSEFITAFNSNGVSLGASFSGTGDVNSSGATYVAWCWKAGGAAVANTDGSIASMVSVNREAGFSIVKTTTTGSGVFTIGHGLGSVPSLILWKSQGVNDWGVYHSSPGVTKAALLNSTMAFAPSSAWNNTSPTAAVFSVSGWGANDYVAYCWAEVPGYSKFGSYTGNGSTDGPYVHCGFRPRWVLFKQSDGTGNWVIIDTERDTYNPSGLDLSANTTSTEDNNRPGIDITASGFKVRNHYSTWNGNGNTHIFAAFAESPFGGKKTTPAKAR